jgi:hypothetical protein
MLPRICASPVASSSRLAPQRPRRARVPVRCLHLSPPSSASRPPDPAPQPAPRAGPRADQRTRTTSTETKPKKVDPTRKTPNFEPNPLGGDQQRKEVFDKRKIIMDELTRLLPSQKGDRENPNDFDNEPLHNYGQSCSLSCRARPDRGHPDAELNRGRGTGASSHRVACSRPDSLASRARSREPLVEWASTIKPRTRAA